MTWLSFARARGVAAAHFVYPLTWPFTMMQSCTAYCMDVNINKHLQRTCNQRIEHITPHPILPH